MDHLLQLYQSSLLQWLHAAPNDRCGQTYRTQYQLYNMWWPPLHLKQLPVYSNFRHFVYCCFFRLCLTKCASWTMTSTSNMNYLFIACSRASHLIAFCSFLSRANHIPNYKHLIYNLSRANHSASRYNYGGMVHFRGW